MNAPLAVVREYQDLIDALRARADELNVSREEIDRIAGLTGGYAAKLMCWPPMKHLGQVSFGSLLAALGVSLIVVDDPEARARHATRMTRRHAEQVRLRTIVSMAPPPWLITAKTAGKMVDLRLAKLTPQQRSRIARRAARARWERAKMVSVP